MKAYYKTAVRLILVLLLFPALSIVAITYQSMDTMRDLSSSYSDKIKDINDSRWLLVSTVIQENREQAQMQSDQVKNDIIDKLSQAYKGNMNQLKIDLDSDTDNLAFFIMNNAISDKYLNNITNDNNDMFIATSKKIIVDKSINCSIGKFTRTLDDETPLHSNPVLAKSAIDLLVNKSVTNIIFWKFLPDTVFIEHDDQLSIPTKEGLRGIYDKYGINGLRGYEILVPSYIKQDTDIFDIPDVNMHGIRNDNYKLIVVQGFSIADILDKSYTTELAYYNYLEQMAKKDFDDKMSKYLSELVTTLSLLLTAFVGIIVTARMFIKWGGDDVIGGCSKG